MFLYFVLTAFCFSVTVPVSDDHATKLDLNCEVQQPKLVSHLFLALGETGIGKSTLMDTLFNTNFENFESSHFEPQVKLRAQTYDLQESNVRLRLTVVNTVGFGDQMNKQERWEEESFASVLLTVRKSDRLKVFVRV